VYSADSKDDYNPPEDEVSHSVFWDQHSSRYSFIVRPSLSLGSTRTPIQHGETHPL